MQEVGNLRNENDVILIVLEETRKQILFWRQRQCMSPYWVLIRQIDAKDKDIERFVFTVYFPPGPCVFNVKIKGYFICCKKKEVIG